MLSHKNIALLTNELKFIHDLDHLLCEGRGYSASLQQDLFQLVVRKIIDVKLNKTISKSSRELFSSSIQTRRVLSSEQDEVGMWFDHSVCLRNEQFTIIIKETIQSLQDLRGGKIQFIKNNPPSISQCLDQKSLFEDQLAILVCDVLTSVLLKIRVLVVIDTNAFVACQSRQIQDERCLSG